MIQTIKNTGRQTGLTNNFQIITNTGNPQDPISTGSANEIFVEVTAAENLNKYDVVTVTGYKADSSNLAHINKVAGIVVENVLTGFIGQVQILGELVNTDWNWSGSLLFLNGTSIQTTAPATGFVKIIGQVKNANIMFINLEESILL